MARDRRPSDPLRRLNNARPSGPQSSYRAATATPIPPAWVHTSLLRTPDCGAAPRRVPSRAPTRRLPAAQHATSPAALRITAMVPTSTVMRPGAPAVDAEHQERSRGPPRSPSIPSPSGPGERTRKRRRAPGATGALRETFSTRQRSIRQNQESRPATQRSFMGASKRIAGPCSKSIGSAGPLPAQRLAAAPGTQVVSAGIGGGLIGQSYRKHHPAVPSRCDGQRRASLPAVAHRARRDGGKR